METSILTSTKKVLGLAPDYTAFDEDVIMYINSAFGTLFQLGVGPTDAFVIEDDTTTWADFVTAEATVPVSVGQLSLIRTYIFLKVGMLFDPPGTSYLIEAKNKQIAEYEWRLSEFRELEMPFLEVPHWVVPEEV